MGDGEPTTQELRLEQAQRAEAERDAERDAATDADERTHRRRGEKAAYLRDKLAEAERAEREAGS